MEIGEYPSIIGAHVEIRTDQSETKHPGRHVLIRGVVGKAVYDINGARYFVIESMGRKRKLKFFMVTERYAGDSMPREFARGSKEVIVGVALVKDDSLLKRDVFVFDEVDYFAIGDIRAVHASDKKKKRGLPEVQNPA